MNRPRGPIPLSPSLPPIIVGGWQLSAGHRDAPRARTEVMEDLVRLVERGFTAFDCADIYTGVEELFGELRARCKQRLGEEAAAAIRIHTKLVPDRSDLGSVDRAYVERIIHRSLRRLGADRLDLVQFAWWDYDTPGYVEAAAWLDELRSAGKVEHVGVTNFDVPRLSEILDAGVAVRTNQVQYSVLDHRPENGMAALCAERGISILCYGALAGGFLSDRWSGANDPAAAVENRSLRKYRLIIDDYGGWPAFQELLRTLRSIADDLARPGSRAPSVAQVALAYSLSRTGVGSVIVGMSRAERLEEAAGAVALALSADQTRSLRALALAAPGPSGDCFGLERVKDGRHAGIMKYDLNQDPTNEGVAHD